jgi:hypothetical protein
MASVIDAATQEERLSMLPGKRLASNVSSGGSRDEKLGAMPQLSGRSLDRAAARDALVRGKGRAVLHRFRHQVKGALCMRLDQLELRKGILVGLDVVAVLHLVEAVFGTLIFAVTVASVPLAIPSRHASRNGTRIGAGVEVDRQQRIHCAGHGDQRLSDIAVRCDRGKLGSDIRDRQPVDVAIGSAARAVSVISRIEPLLPLA